MNKQEALIKIKEILFEKDKVLFHQMKNIPDLGNMPVNLREKIGDFLLKELLNNIDNEGEPNEYGKLVDNLIWICREQGFIN